MDINEFQYEAGLPFAIWGQPTLVSLCQNDLYRVVMDHAG